MSDQTVTDEQILELAQELKAEHGISLVEAMDMASAKLNKAAGKEIDCEFLLPVTLKPRVAKFFRDTFSGHPDLTVDQRMGKYVEILLNKVRGEALVRTREEPEVRKGEAVSVRHSTFLERNLG